MGEVPGLRRRRRAARHVRRHRRRRGAGARRLGRRVPARGPAPAAPAEQGPRRGRRHLPALSGHAPDPDGLPDPRSAAPRPRRRRRAGARRARCRRRAKYRRWDGTQDLPDLTADEIVDALADDVLEHGDLGEALRRPHGARRCAASDPSRGDLRGLRDLLDRLRDRREELLRQGALPTRWRTCARSSTRSWTAERAGRPAAARRASRPSPTPTGDSGSADPDPTASGCCARSPRSGSTRLDALPPDVGARIRGLQDYDFMDQDARERFEALRRPPARQRARPAERGPGGRGARA